MKKSHKVNKLKTAVVASICLIMVICSSLSSLISLGNSGSVSAEKTASDSNHNNTLLSDSQFKNLKCLGYKESEIKTCSLTLERVKYQIEDIINSNMIADTTAYRDLLQNINEDQGIYYMLKLKKDFGSYDKVLDEYLCALQFKIVLSDYISNRAEYLKEKKNKETAMDTSKLITLDKLEEQSIEILQQQNKNNNASKYNDNGKNNSLQSQNNNPAGSNGGNLNSNDTSSNKDQGLNLSPAQNDKPTNPGQDAMKEINDIKQRSFNGQ